MWRSIENRKVSQLNDGDDATAAAKAPAAMPRFASMWAMAMARSVQDFLKLFSWLSVALHVLTNALEKNQC